MISIKIIDENLVSVNNCDSVTDGFLTPPSPLLPKHLQLCANWSDASLSSSPLWQEPFQLYVNSADGNLWLHSPHSMRSLQLHTNMSSVFSLQKSGMASNKMKIDCRIVAINLNNDRDVGAGYDRVGSSGNITPESVNLSLVVNPRHACLGRNHPCSCRTKIC